MKIALKSERLRPDIDRLSALLLLSRPESALTMAASLDVRDLNEWELAHLEGISVRTLQKWRLNGGGPPFRRQGGIRYPVRLWLEWRESGIRGPSSD